MQRLERIVAKTKLGTGYFHADELERMTGQPPYRFAGVVLKELLDNALDACETAGVAPVISVEVREQEVATTISVTDNAGGIPPETVAGILDFDIRISDKSVYRSPTRGQMGNAWKTIIGIPYALGVKDPITITGRGVKHTIRAWPDPTGDVEITYDQAEAELASGTTVCVTLPEHGEQVFEPELWVRSAALYNPHVFFIFRHHDVWGSEAHEMYKPTVSGDPSKFKKVKPHTPTSQHWYDVASLEKNIFAHLKNAKEGTGKDLPTGRYIGTFAGLKRTQSQANVRRLLSHQVQYLSDYEDMDEETRRAAVQDLLGAMQRETDPPKHDALGKLGKEHFKARFEEMYGIEDSKSFWYQMTEGYQNGIPWRFEVALAKVVRPAQLFTGVNYSPTFGDPLDNMTLETPEEYGNGLADLLDELHVHPCEAIFDAYPPADNGQPHTAVAIHFSSPVVSYQDLGKSSINTKGLLPSPNSKPIATAVWDVSKTLYKKERSRRKQANRPVREAKPQGEKEPDQKEAAFQVMKEAVEHVSGGGTLPYNARRLFYAVRDRIPAITSKRFHPDNGYDYFRGIVLQEYQQEHGKLEGLYYDPRGRLHEPHTREMVDIGTREVEAYTFPEYVFDKILYVEKKGQMPLLEAASIGERFDMAIMTGEGFATEAARVLLENASKEQDYQLFVLHDADPSGYNIARTVREETERMPGYSVDVIDLGLKVEEVVGLEDVHAEEFVHKSKLAKPLLDSLEEGSLAREWFVGEEIEITEDNNNKKRTAYRRRRVELDSLSAPQVIEYLERKLRESDVRGKVIPPDDYLEDNTRSKYEDKVRSVVGRIVNDIVSTERIQKIVARLFRERYELDDARQWIEKGFEEDDKLSWETPVERRLSQRSVELEAELQQMVRKVFKKIDLSQEALEESEDGDKS